MRRDDAHVIDIANSAGRIIAFTRGMTKTELAADEKTQAAVLYHITLLGEATKRLTTGFKEAHPEIPWKDIAGARDVMIHDYHRVNIDEVWRIVERDVPDLISKLQPLVPPEEA